MDLTEAKKALDKAKIQLMARPNTTFITTVCFSMIHEFCEKIPTAATNGLRVKYNPNFFMKQSPDKQLGLLLHETWHVAFNHIDEMYNRPGINPDRLNVAQDYVINNMLDSLGFELPDGGYMDHKFDGMSAMQIYPLIPDPPKDHHNDIEPSGLPSDEARERLNDVLIKATLQSKMAGDDAGSIPGSIQVYVDTLTNPKLPWDRILTRYFNRMQKSDYSFRKPNKRYLPYDVILPTAYSEALGDVAFAFDMSGSVSDKETKQFVSDSYHVLKKVKPRTLNLVQFDTRVFQVDEIRTEQELMRINFRGRGGTTIDPVMEWGQKHQPDVLVVFTDGYFRPASFDPGVPVIWIIHDNPKWTAPFGKVIHYNIK
ncbi:DUF2201 family putative metallopeptidase [Marinobacter shengliensis]|uniref:vWA domain-containing protein n=1 Tax=Marinobacter shengliensis TaxID=1389223 RepID=UPI001E5769E3|nr:VWA-like domain-containing protein [Marinobacter shengliensis]MCD1628495.1 VWA-like domain-containing protein [Marinobacter shengliensis]